MNEIRIVIADDSEPMLYMLRELLKADYDVVASVADGRAAVEAAQRLKPELVLLDISMPIVDGFEAARQISDKPAHHGYSTALPSSWSTG